MIPLDAPTLLLLDFAAWMLVFGLFLLIGQITGQINLYELVKDGDEMAGRKVFECGAFISTTTVLMYCVATNRAIEMVLTIYSGIWVARSLLGILTGAKAKMMSAAMSPWQGPGDRRQAAGDRAISPEARIGRGTVTEDS
jgi:hypothetical protein